MLSNKTPKLDRSDGAKEMKEKAPKRKLPFTAGANGDQKDSDTGKAIFHCYCLSYDMIHPLSHHFEVEQKKGVLHLHHILLNLKEVLSHAL